MLEQNIKTSTKHQLWFQQLNKKHTKKLAKLEGTSIPSKELKN